MSVAGAMRIHEGDGKSCVDDVAHKPSDAPALPSWLRDAYAETITLARGEIVRQAKRGMAGGGESDAGILADQRIKIILEAAGLRMPSVATAAAYRRDHAHMLAARTTPSQKATTFQHFNRLRSAWKFSEVEVIRALRREAEAARKRQDHSRMRAMTVAAYERAALLDAMFLCDLAAPSRQTWGKKNAALRAAGIGKGEGRSKRAAGRAAPTPDQLLVLLTHQGKRCARVEIAAAVFACFGIRPAEMRSGVRLYLDGDGLCLEVHGAKVDAARGQFVRTLSIDPSRFGCSALAVALLRGEVAVGRSQVQLSEADLAAVRRAMRAAQPGLSPYAFRHARASDAKAGHGVAGAAAWLGHRTDRAQSGYGHGRSSSGAVKITGACVSSPVRRLKSLPAGVRALASTRAAAAYPASIPKQSRARVWKPRRPRC